MDLDADGYNDILSGSYSRSGLSMAGLFQVLWGKPDGTFRKAAVLKGTDGKPLIIPTSGRGEEIEAICTRPTAVDWDGDGDLDLIVGNFAGKFYWFKGEGAGKFAPKPELIQSGDKPLTVPGHHGDPFVVDWDGDGDLDLLSGSNAGGVHWAENTAGRKEIPKLKPFTVLIPAPQPLHNECPPDAVKTPAGSTRIWVADVNGDGKLDVLVGDNVSLISPAKGVSQEEFEKRYAAWKQELETLEQEFAGKTDEKVMEGFGERWSKHYEERKKFMKEDDTGFVWLYLRK